MKESSLKIYRHGEPSKLDTAPQGTECWVIISHDPNMYSIYQQVSSNEENPNWVYIGIKQEIDII